MDWLITNLLDLVYELRDRGIPLIVGGGFGLYLKRQWLEQERTRTLLARLPEPRATNDLDLFVSAEVLADPARTREVAEAIRRLGYTPVKGAEFMQWIRPILINGVEQQIKIDLLVGPLGKHRSALKVKDPRVRPKQGDIQFHAHLVNEAVRLEEEPLEVEIAGRRSNGEDFRAAVHVPQAFPYLMMKLHAFDDRSDDTNKDLGRHHALDLYSIVGMMIESEYESALRIRDDCTASPHYARARGIVARSFSSETDLGLLRLREHPLYRSDFETGRFIEVLGEIFRDPEDGEMSHAD